MHEDWRQQPYRYEKSETCGARSTHGQILGILIHLEVGRNWIMDLCHVIIHYLFVERENCFDQQTFGKRMIKGVEERPLPLKFSYQRWGCSTCSRIHYDWKIRFSYTWKTDPFFWSQNIHIQGSLCCPPSLMTPSVLPNVKVLLLMASMEIKQATSTGIKPNLV